MPAAFPLVDGAQVRILAKALMNKKDIASMRNVLRYIATSDRDIREEVLRLDALLEKLQQTKPKEGK